MENSRRQKFFSMVSYFLLGYFVCPRSSLFKRREQKNGFMLLTFISKAFTGNNMLYSYINNRHCLQQSITKVPLYFLLLNSTPSPPILQPAWQGILHPHIHTSHLYVFMMTLTMPSIIPVLKQQQLCKISPVKGRENSFIKCRSYPFIFLAKLF